MKINELLPSKIHEQWTSQIDVPNLWDTIRRNPGKREDLDQFRLLGHLDKTYDQLGQVQKDLFKMMLSKHLWRIMKSGSLPNKLTDIHREVEALNRRIGVSESISREDLSDAITARMMSSGLANKLLRAHGLDRVIDAISSVTEQHQGADELGSSDISIMIKQVQDELNSISENTGNPAQAPQAGNPAQAGNTVSAGKKATTVGKPEDEVKAAANAAQRISANPAGKTAAAQQALAAAKETVPVLPSDRTKAQQAKLDKAKSGVASLPMDNVLDESWKTDLAGLALSAGLIAGGVHVADQNIRDTRTIDGMEVTHFSGVPGVKVTPTKATATKIDGKPAWVWWGKGKQGAQELYWNYADDPQMRQTAMRDVTAASVPLPPQRPSVPLPPRRDTAPKAQDSIPLPPQRPSVPLPPQRDTEYKSHAQDLAARRTAVNESPGMGDRIVFELADGRAFEASVAEVRGNSVVVDLDETAHQWLEESPDHSHLKIQGASMISPVAKAWNDMIDDLDSDTPQGWAQLFRARQQGTEAARKWGRLWRQQHTALGDTVSHDEQRDWEQKVSDYLSEDINTEISEQEHVIRKTLNSKDRVLTKIYMDARRNGVPLKKYAQDLAVKAGMPRDHYWQKIKPLVHEQLLSESDAHAMLWPIITKVLGRKLYTGKNAADVYASHTDDGLELHGAVTRGLQGNEELELEQAFHDAGIPIEKVKIEPDLIRISLHGEIHENTADPYSQQTKYYIVRKNAGLNTIPGKAGSHTMAAAREQLAQMPDADHYEIRAINTTKIPQQQTIDEDKIDHNAREKLTNIINQVLGLHMIKRQLKPLQHSKQGMGWVAMLDGVLRMPEHADTMLAEALVRYGFRLEELHVLHHPDTNEATIIIRLAEPYKMTDPDYVIETVQEAKYHGKTVKLGKPIRTNTGEGGKFKVYVRDPKTGNIKMVRFGDTTGLSIKRDDPKRRKSYRARHHCENPGPRTKANYWSCRMWTRKPVGKILKGK
jgi:hypothetical protein